MMSFQLGHMSVVLRGQVDGKLVANMKWKAEAAAAEHMACMSGGGWRAGLDLCGQFLATQVFLLHSDCVMCGRCNSNSVTVTL